jgi:hypothetical protein
MLPLKVLTILTSVHLARAKVKIHISDGSTHCGGISITYLMTG